MIDEKTQENQSHQRKRVKVEHYKPLTYNRTNINKAEKSTDNTMPCNNIKCRWIQYLHYFYAKSLGFWLLPAVTPEDHCEVCRLVNTGERKLSDFQISKDFKVCIDGKILC